MKNMSSWSKSHADIIGKTYYDNEIGEFTVVDCKERKIVETLDADKNLSSSFLEVKVDITTEDGTNYSVPYSKLEKTIG